MFFSIKFWDSVGSMPINEIKKFKLPALQKHCWFTARQNVGLSLNKRCAEPKPMLTKTDFMLE